MIPGVENRESGSARLRKYPIVKGVSSRSNQDACKGKRALYLAGYILPNVLVQTETAVRADELQLTRGSAQSESDDSREQHEKGLKVIGYDKDPLDNLFGDHQLNEVPSTIILQPSRVKLRN